MTHGCVGVGQTIEARDGVGEGRGDDDDEACEVFDEEKDSKVDEVEESDGEEEEEEAEDDVFVNTSTEEHRSSPLFKTTCNVSLTTFPPKYPKMFVFSGNSSSSTPRWSPIFDVHVFFSINSLLGIFTQTILSSLISIWCWRLIQLERRPSP